jgi:inorganic pyrophosphatase
MNRRLRDLGAGNKVPNYVYVVIETPFNSRVKYKYDEDLDLIIVDKVLGDGLTYPFNQGFIPGTKDESGEPLEAIVLSNEIFLPGVLVESKPIGTLEIIYEDSSSIEIVAVPHERINPLYGSIRDISDLPKEFMEKIESFFTNYRIYGVDKWISLRRIGRAQEAREKILEAIKRYSIKEKH